MKHTYGLLMLWHQDFLRTQSQYSKSGNNAMKFQLKLGIIFSVPTRFSQTFSTDKYIIETANNACCIFLVSCTITTYKRHSSSINSNIYVYFVHALASLSQKPEQMKILEVSVQLLLHCYSYIQMNQLVSVRQCTCPWRTCFQTCCLNHPMAH